MSSVLKSQSFTASEFSKQLSAKSAEEQLKLIQSTDRKWFGFCRENLSLFLLVIDKSIKYKFLEYLGKDLILEHGLINNSSSMMITIKMLPEHNRLPLIKLLGADWLQQHILIFQDFKNLITSVPGEQQDDLLGYIEDTIIVDCTLSIFNLIELMGLLSVGAQIIFLEKLNNYQDALYELIDTKLLADLVYKLHSSKAKEIIYLYSSIAPDYIEIKLNEVLAADLLSETRTLLDRHKNIINPILMPCIDKLFEITAKPQASYEKGVSELQSMLNNQRDEFKKHISSPGVNELLKNLSENLTKFYQHNECKKSYTISCIINTPRPSEDDLKSESEIKPKYIQRAS